MVYQRLSSHFNHLSEFFLETHPPFNIRICRLQKLTGANIFDEVPAEVSEPPTGLWVVRISTSWELELLEMVEHLWKTPVSFSYDWWNPVCMKRLKRFSLMFYSRMDIESQLGLNIEQLLLFFGLIFSTRSHTKCRTQLPKKSAIGQVVLRQRLRSDGTKRVCRKEVLGNWCLSQMVHHVRKDFNVSRYIQISLRYHTVKILISLRYWLRYPKYHTFPNIITISQMVIFFPQINITMGYHNPQ